MPDTNGHEMIFSTASMTTYFFWHKGYGVKNVIYYHVVEFQMAVYIIYSTSREILAEILYLGYIIH